MQMKQQASNLSGKSATAKDKKSGTRSNVNRLRVHYLKRFKRATQGATKLKDICNDAVDEPSSFELVAYEELMRA